MERYRRHIRTTTSTWVRAPATSSITPACRPAAGSPSSTRMPTSSATSPGACAVRPDSRPGRRPEAAAGAGPFASAALNLVIHCLPGPLERKAVPWRTWRGPGADRASFRASVLGRSAITNGSRGASSRFNRQGGFDNLDDTEDGLREILGPRSSRSRSRRSVRRRSSWRGSPRWGSSKRAASSARRRVAPAATGVGNGIATISHVVGQRPISMPSGSSAALALIADVLRVAVPVHRHRPPLTGFDPRELDALAAITVPDDRQRSIGPVVEAPLRRQPVQVAAARRSPCGEQGSERQPSDPSACPKGRGLADRLFDDGGELLLVFGGQLGDCPRGRPHGAVVELRVVVEAEGRVARLELARGLEEASVFPPSVA